MPSAFAIAVATSSVNFSRRSSESNGRRSSADETLIAPHKRPSTTIGLTTVETMPSRFLVAATDPLRDDQSIASTRAAYTNAGFVPGGLDGVTEITGDDWAVGFTVGGLFEYRKKGEGEDGCLQDGRIGIQRVRLDRQGDVGGHRAGVRANRAAVVLDVLEPELPHVVRLDEHGVVGLILWFEVRDLAFDVFLPVALDEGFHGMLDATNVLVVAVQRLLHPFLAAQLLVLDRALTLEEQPGLLVEEQVDVAVALVRYPDTDGRLVPHFTLAQGRQLEALVLDER